MKNIMIFQSTYAMYSPPPHLHDRACRLFGKSNRTPHCTNRTSSLSLVPQVRPISLPSQKSVRSAYPRISSTSLPPSSSLSTHLELNRQLCVSCYRDSKLAVQPCSPLSNPFQTDRIYDSILGCQCGSGSLFFLHQTHFFETVREGFCSAWKIPLPA